MELKGKYKLSYILDKEPKDLIFEIELKMIEGLMKSAQNVWEGHASLNGQPYTKEDLTRCVNARLAAERIGKGMRDKIRTSARSENKHFKIKKEEIK